jgi:hypothetical protein
VLLLVAFLVALIGTLSVAHEEAKFASEKNLGAGIMVMMFAMPVFGLLALSLMFWILGLLNLVYRGLVNRSKQVIAD